MASLAAWLRLRSLQNHRATPNFAASANEQQTLWSAAKSIQKAVRAAGAQQDYLLFADFLMAPNRMAGAVHTFLLSPA